MTGFTLVHPLINLEIKLEEVDRLHIHEEILRAPLRRLVEAIKSDKCLMHPVIVDGKSLVVLDGMHRVAAIRELGCRFMPVCLVDYDNPNVVLGCWYRTVNTKPGIEGVTRVIGELGFALRRCQTDVARGLVENREAIASLASRSKCYSIHGTQGDIKDIYDAIKEIELKLESEGYSIGYDAESDARNKVASGEVSSMLMVPTASKEEVIKTALKGQGFNHKTTRHVVPARPLFLNVPLEWLYSKSSPEKANEKLVKYLSTKKFKRLPPGQILDRRYEEEIYIFR